MNKKNYANRKLIGAELTDRKPATSWQLLPLVCSRHGFNA